MSIVEYETQLFREHQGKMASFIDFLKKNKDNVQDKQDYVYKLIQLNELFIQAENLAESIKYECVYPKVIKNQEKIGKDSKRLKAEMQEHLETQQKIKRLAVLGSFL